MKTKPPLVLIDELIDQTAQGMTRPWRCIGHDGQHYFVKIGSSAGWRSLICEWLAGRLAQRLGLPIAPFAQVYIDEVLVEYQRQLGHRDLSAGEAFGSRRVALTRDIDPTLLQHCKLDFRRDLVAFDWWVRNSDRTLGEHSGNPNLLWSVQPAGPVVIDHNLAFAADFDPVEFSRTHIFRADFEQICADQMLREDYRQRFARLLPEFDTIWSELPDNWLHTEDGDARVNRADFESLLRRVELDSFWHVAPSSDPDPS